MLGAISLEELQILLLGATFLTTARSNLGILTKVLLESLQLNTLAMR